MHQRRVLIAGCHRSGTTLLRLILDSHKDIHCFDEWTSYDILSDKKFHNKDNPILGFKIPNWTELIVDYLDYRQYYNNDPILFMMRDVRAVIASMVTLPTGEGTWFKGLVRKMDKEWPNDPYKKEFFKKYGNELEEINNKSESSYRKAALYWKYKNSKYLDMVKLSWPVLPIRYECFVKEPLIHLEVITDFLSANLDCNMLVHYDVEHDEVFNGYAVGNSLVSRSIDTSSVNKWKTILTDEQETAILEVAGDLNKFISVLPYE